MERIGRYQVEKELGRGSMSIVYKAFDPRIDRFIAIKVLRQAYARDLACRQRFLREARAAGGLSHPNIVTVFDVGQVEGIPYMAMELLEGETLAERFESQGRPALGSVLDLGIQLTSALTYAHERGVIHRDLKPANIHFDHRSGVVKLMDFGIADIEDSPRKPVARRGTVLGTPAYMAPEQVLGHDLDGRTDLYALGVLLYHLLSGREPFRSERLSDLMVQIVNQPPERLVPEDTEAPKELIEMVHKLLAKNPDARFVRGDQVLEELQDIRAGVNRRLIHPGRKASIAWRWPLAVGTGVALVLALGLYLIHDRQTQAMADTTYGYGEALTSIIANEVAEALILDDNTALATLVNEFASNPRVRYLHVSGRDGQVRASTDAFLQGEPRPVPGGREIPRASDNVRILRVGEEVLEFQVPVSYQANRVGEVQLGVDAGDLSAVAGLTLRMMALVFGVTMIAMLLALYVLARRLALLAERLGWGMSKIGRGHYEFRLEVRRRDELGTLFRRFNDMANRLEERYGGGRGDDTEYRPAGLRHPPREDVDHSSTVDLGEALDGETDLEDAGDNENVTPLKPRHRRQSE